MKTKQNKIGTCLAVTAFMVTASSSEASISSTGSVFPVDPATATSSDDVYAGYTGTGSITVDGSSTLNADEVVIGDGGAGQLAVEGSGANLQAGYLYAGYNTNGSATFKTGASATIGEMYLGYDAQGHLSITGGSVVNSTHSYLGYDGNGYLDISGAGSVWNITGEFYSGYDGAEDGFLNISNGGHVNINNAGEVIAMTYQADSTYNFGIGDDGTGSISAGKITAAGDVSRDGGAGNLFFAMTIDPGSAIASGTKFTLIDYGTWNAGNFQVSDGAGGFMTLADGDTYTVDGKSFIIDYDTDLGGGDLALTATFVPEPSSLALLALGSAGLIARRKRKN